LRLNSSRARQASRTVPQAPPAPARRGTVASPRRRARGSNYVAQDPGLPTTGPLGPWDDVRLEALWAHGTQVDPTSPFGFGRPRGVARTTPPYDEYTLATSLVDTALPEDDLFAGLR